MDELQRGPIQLPVCGPTPTQVAELLEVLRAHGVRSNKAEGIEIVLEPAAAKGRPHIVTTTYPIAPNSNTETVE